MPQEDEYSKKYNIPYDKLYVDLYYFWKSQYEYRANLLAAYETVSNCIVRILDLTKTLRCTNIKSLIKQLEKPTKNIFSKYKYNLDFCELIKNGIRKDTVKDGYYKSINNLLDPRRNKIEYVSQESVASYCSNPDCQLLNLIYNMRDKICTVNESEKIPDGYDIKDKNTTFNSKKILNGILFQEESFIKKYAIKNYAALSLDNISRSFYGFDPENRNSVITGINDISLTEYGNLSGKLQLEIDINASLNDILKNLQYIQYMTFSELPSLTQIQFLYSNLVPDYIRIKNKIKNNRETGHSVEYNSWRAIGLWIFDEVHNGHYTKISDAISALMNHKWLEDETQSAKLAEDFFVSDTVIPKYYNRTLDCIKNCEVLPQVKKTLPQVNK